MRLFSLSQLALCSTLALTGCALPGPDRTALTPLSPAGAGLADSTAANMPTARWWTTLGDAKLNALIDEALQGSPSLAASHARFERALALASASSSAAQPHGSLALDATRQRYSANGMVPAPIAGNIYNSGNLQAGLSWSADFFGRHAAELTSALGQARAAQADSAAAATELAAQVARSYVALARLLAQREVAARSLAQRQQLLDLSAQRTRAGLDSQVELTQAQAALPEASIQIEMLDEQITLARRTIAVLCGQAPETQQGLKPQLAQLSLQELPQVLGADLLGRRPDIVAARWRVEAAGAEIQRARADFYPDFNITAFIGLNAIGLDQLFKSGSQQMGITPALRLPIFDGTRLRAQLHGRQAELDLAIAQYNGAVLSAAKQAGDAIASVQSLGRQQALQTQASAKAERAYDFAVQRYRAGLTQQMTVLSTESQVLAQRRQAIDLQARALDTRIGLMQALGGGWSDETSSLQISQRSINQRSRPALAEQTSSEEAPTS